MDAQLGYAFAHWLNVSHQSARQALDPGYDHAANRFIVKSIKPSGKLRKWLDGDHN
jgi:hypothetical protein